MKQGPSRIDYSAVEFFKIRGTRKFEDEVRKSFMCSFDRFKEPITWITFENTYKTNPGVHCVQMAIKLQRTIVFLIIFVFDAGTVPVPNSTKKEKGSSEEIKDSVT